MIKPVYHRYQQKNVMFDLIRHIFLQAHRRNFAELFGGTGYISLNMKDSTTRFQLEQVDFNDYDKMLPVTKAKAVHNWTSWQGIGKTSCKSNFDKAEERWANPKWQEKIEDYNLVLELITIYKDRSYLTFDYNNDWFLYLDPPGTLDSRKYEMTTFDHLALLRKCRVWVNRGCRFLLTYPLDYDIANLYKEFVIKKVGDYLFITNFQWKANAKVMPKFKTKEK